MSLQQTKEQERAARAWEYVGAVQGKSFEGEYCGWVKKLPALVLTNGLGQTLAFLLAKGKNKQNAPQTLYDHLSVWVMSEVAHGQPDSLLQWIMRKDSPTYRRATTEALAFIVWLKRFAEATLKAKEPDRGDEED
jgi:CRISPR-associated protein Cmr5